MKKTARAPAVSAWAAMTGAINLSSSDWDMASAGLPQPTKLKNSATAHMKTVTLRIKPPIFCLFLSIFH